jgi:hypothetical protein
MGSLEPKVKRAVLYSAVYGALSFVFEPFGKTVLSGEAVRYLRRLLRDEKGSGN